MNSAADKTQIGGDHYKGLGQHPPVPNRAPRPSVDALAAPASLLRIETVLLLVSLSRTQVYRLINRGDFPAPIRLGARCSRWRAGAVADWLNAQR